MFVLSELLVSVTSTSFVYLHLLVSERTHVLPVRVFIVVLQELHCSKQYTVGFHFQK